MPYDFYSLLRKSDSLSDMPPVKIQKRNTDKSVTYNKQRNRLDTVAGTIYQDETLWRVILWANEQYFMEFDIPDNTIIRVPYPIQDVLTEISTKITLLRDRG